MLFLNPCWFLFRISSKYIDNWVCTNLSISLHGSFIWLIGLQFLTSFKSPAFGIGVTSARPQSNGNVPSLKHLLKRKVNSLTITEKASLKSLELISQYAEDFDISISFINFVTSYSVISKKLKPGYSSNMSMFGCQVVLKLFSKLYPPWHSIHSCIQQHHYLLSPCHLHRPMISSLYLCVLSPVQSYYVLYARTFLDFPSLYRPDPLQILLSHFWLKILLDFVGFCKYPKQN